MSNESRNNSFDALSHLEMILDCAPEVIYSKDLDGRYLFINRRFENLSDLKRADVIGKTDRQLFPESVAENSTRNDQIVIDTRKPLFIGEFGPVDGELRYFQSAKYPLFDDQGDLCGTCGFSVDVTNEELPENVIENTGEGLSKNTEILLAKQEELIRKGALFKGLFDHMTSGSAIYEVINDGLKGSDFIIRGFNRRSLEMEGKTLDEVLGRSLFDLRPNIDDYGLIEVMREVWKTGKPSYFPVKIYQDENFSNYYENLIFRIPSGEVVTIYNDVTRQKQDELNLKRSEERYELAMQFTNDGLFDWNLKKNTIYFSPGWKKLLGYEDHEIKNDFSEWERLTRPEDVEASWAILKELLAGHRERFDNEFKMRHKDGHWVDILARANVIFDEEGEGSRVIGTHVDITERKKAEAALRESEQRFRRVYDHMSIGIAKVNLDFLIENANEAYCQMLGYSEEELIGKHLRDFTRPDVVKENLEKQIRLATGEIDHYRMEKVFIHKNGDHRYGILNANLVRNDNGEPAYFLGSVLDVTEKRQLEQQLQQTQKMEAIGTLAGGIAHDFNNLLGVITGNVSYVMSKYGDIQELNEVLSDIQEGTHQAQMLTHQLLTFAKGGEPVKKTNDINALIRQSARFITSGTHSKCEFNLAMDLSTADVDHGQISQVISNLAINADQAMPGGGVIRINTRNVSLPHQNTHNLKTGNYVEITVSDTGIGISEEHLHSIFDPYFTTKQQGSGLGLATAYSIINRHDGRISVHSELGKGTTFCILLPADTSKPETEETPENVRHQGQGRVLIMDDQISILKMLERMLIHLGYQVVRTQDGAAALAEFRLAHEKREPFDLVILDLTVPGGMGGAKTMPELMKIDPNVKAIVSSGYSTDPIMASFEDYGFCGVVQKPYTRSQLAELLNEIFCK